MSVSLSSIHVEKSQEFRLNSTSTVFMDAFLIAARNTVRRLEIHQGQGTTLETITGLIDIDTIPSEYTYVVSEGITYWLMKLGQKPKDSRTVKEAQASWEDAAGDYNMGIMLQNSQTASNSIVGLGAIGINDTSE